MNQVFLDTSALIALAVKSDEFHGRAVAVRSQLTESGARIVTSQWVLVEFLNAMRFIGTRLVAANMVDALRHSGKTTIVPAGESDWQSSIGLYRERLDKEWSLVDCTSMLICRQLSINQVFTSDHHFTQAGFEILL
jgi:predicted nucleic acid-binding protein